MNHKRGVLVVDEILGIVLAAAGIFILGMLFYALLAPHFNRPQEAAKSYLHTLEGQLKIAEQGGKGEFELSSIDSGGDLYVVNFAGTYALDVGTGTPLFNPTTTNNTINVCYDHQGVDNGCYYKALAYPLKFIEYTQTQVLQDQCVIGVSTCMSTCQHNQERVGVCKLSTPSTGSTQEGLCCMDKKLMRGGEGSWYFGKGEKYFITLEGGTYVFKKIN